MSRFGRRAGGAICWTLVALLVLAGPAAGHSLPQSSDPSPGSTLAVPPTTVSITFGEEPDPKLSSIKVLDTSGAAQTSGPAAALPGDALTLSVPLKPLVPGVYTVAWRTVSAVDGHAASGSFAFGVGVSPPSSGGAAGAAPIQPPGPAPAAIVGRWLLYLGLLGLLGAACFGILIALPPRIMVRRLLPLTWLSAAAGTFLVLGVELGDAGEGVAEAMGTSLGPAIVWRLGFLVVAGVAVIVVRSGAGGRAGLAAVGLGAAGALGVDTLLSHAAAGPNAAFDVFVQATHVLAVGLWLGGLVALLVALRWMNGDPAARAARRFSRLATVGIAVVALTGLLRAVPEVGTLDALVATDFGRLVIAKSALLGVIAVLGAINHFRSVPAAGASQRGLRRVGSAELLVGATVVLLSASLVNLAPPSQVAASSAGQPRELLALGADFGTSVRVRLEVSPGTAGFDTFRATVSDYDSGAPVSADHVTLRFQLPARPDVGSSRLDLPAGGPGVFEASGANLSLDGTWQVTALVARGATSVEVPLQVTTLVQTPVIDVNANPGLPTIYTVHLPAGRTVQVYADPGTAGQNELHTTFFDAAGIELPLADVTLALAVAGGPAKPLATRELEPGHFVADVVLEAGTYTLSIAGPAPGGDYLTTHLDLPISK
ncbi:MAG: copper resistance protein CopC [Candidatus Limnocylindrales bacterium]